MNHRIVIPLVAALSAAGGVVAAGPVRDAGDRAVRVERPDPVAVQQARAVVESARVGADAGVDPTLSPRDVRSWAARRSQVLPLPVGGNFNGVQWERAGQGVSAREADAALQYNARCQWLRAARDGRERATAEAVLRLARRWPALEGAEVAAGLRTMQPTQQLAVCDASHLREQAYARGLGLRPSS